MTSAPWELTWDPAQDAYRAPCGCGGDHVVWQYGIPWIVQPCSACGRHPHGQEDRRWRREALQRGPHPLIPTRP
jgi:hypothetical protein